MLTGGKRKAMQSPKRKQIYKEGFCRVEPMQGLIKNIFELDHCWMRGNANNRWLFAAMDLYLLARPTLTNMSNINVLR